MKLITFAVLIVTCNAAKLDRTYLPPSAANAGGTSDILSLPFTRSNNQGLGGLPAGSYENESQGIVVDAAVGTRSSDVVSGLGAPRISYGSTASKVGEAAFRDSPNRPELNTYSSGRPERIQASRDRVASIVRYQTDISPDSYNYAFQTDNGINAEEAGVSIDGVNSEGGFSYTGDDGQVYSVTYTAGKDGYKPMGSHLPTPPPIPVEILQALEQNAKDEAAGLVDDGSYDTNKYNVGGEYSENYNNDAVINKLANRPTSVAQSGINQGIEVSRPNIGNFGFNKQSDNQKVPSGEPVQFVPSKLNIGSTGTYNQFNNQYSPSTFTFGNSVASKPSNYQIIDENTRVTTLNQQASPISQTASLFDKTQIQSNNNPLESYQYFGAGQNINAHLSGNADNHNQEFNKQTTSIPLSQQKLQNQVTSPGSTFLSSKPTSYETSISGQPQTGSIGNNQHAIGFAQSQEEGNHILKPHLNQSVQTDITQASFGQSLTNVAQSLNHYNSHEGNGLINNNNNIHKFTPSTNIDISNEPSDNSPIKPTQSSHLQEPTRDSTKHFSNMKQYFQPTSQAQVQTTQDLHNFQGTVKPSQLPFFQPIPSDASLSSSTSFSQIQGHHGTYNFDQHSRPFSSSKLIGQNYQIPVDTSSTVIASTDKRLSGISFIQQPTSHSVTLTESTSFNSPNQFFITSNRFPSAIIPVTGTPLNQDRQPEQSSTFAKETTSPQQQSQPNKIVGTNFDQSSVLTQITGQPQNSQNEIYEYTKPMQSFSDTTKPDDNPVSQDNKATVVSEPAKQNNFNTQTNNMPQSELTPGQNIDTQRQPILDNKPNLSKPTPGQSASPSQFNTRPLFGSTILGSACCKNKIQNTQTQLEQKLIYNENQALRPQQENTNLFRAQPNQGVIGEQFDANRKPPSFDATGYHY
ncbi:GATA zinc finger domain-containing protein 14-like [Leptidea sinapis]|uniref:GATA zinc finger domain-containing protein 14-like n=1 Tax=Leptidea sinapis TaxID=189913 RepID=UPI0021C28667|nr:GATA zinc finger domain-containing protein 14-like [Leptidea sinapis]